MDDQDNAYLLAPSTATIVFDPREGKYYRQTHVEIHVHPADMQMNTTHSERVRHTLPGMDTRAALSGPLVTKDLLPQLLVVLSAGQPLPKENLP